jgi:hypothetical protein
VLFSGQDQLPGLVGQAGTWSLSALAWLILFKALAYTLSLGSYRGGPTFPALFLGAAGGIMAYTCRDSPSNQLSPWAWAPRSSACSGCHCRRSCSRRCSRHAGNKLEPLIMVGVVVSYIVTLLISRSPAPGSATAPTVPAPEPSHQASRVHEPSPHCQTNARRATAHAEQRLAASTDHGAPPTTRAPRARDQARRLGMRTLLSSRHVPPPHLRSHLRLRGTREVAKPLGSTLLQAQALEQQSTAACRRRPPYRNRADALLVADIPT